MRLGAAGTIEVVTPFDAVTQAQLRAIRPQGHWFSRRRCWEFPLEAGGALNAGLGRRFHLEPELLQWLAWLDQPLPPLPPHRQLVAAAAPAEPLADQRRLFAHQRAAVRWLLARRGALLADPMGLGKTLTALVAAAKSQGAVCALDNTWGAGLAFNAFELGVDISMHALTKYPSGGADVLMGSVVTRDEALHQRIHQAHAVLGIGVAANDCELLLRSLPSIRVRYDAHDQSARALATWLGQQPQVSQVLHPALPGAPGHEHWKRHCTAAAGLFSVMFNERLDARQVDAFVDGLELFSLGYSWGGPMSLAVPYDLSAMRDPAHRLPGHLVRFSIGLEAVEDLRADLAQAMSRAF